MGNTDNGDETGFHGCWRSGGNRGILCGSSKELEVVCGAEIRCFAELNMTRKIHYCFGDFRLLEMGGKRRNSIAVCRKRVKAAYELKQVFCGAQHDEENSLLFWGLPIVEDGEADFRGGRA
jgi:hypothetical protein